MAHKNDIETESYRPAWMRIADDLAGSINEGAYAADTVLPGAYELADHYGVNRHTVRQALLHLQDAGLVRVQRGKGASVLARRVPYPIGRKVSFRSNLAAAGLTVSGRVLDHQRGPASDHVAHILSLEPGHEVFTIQTLNMAGGIPISHSVRSVDAVRFPDFVKHLIAAEASSTSAFRACGVGDYVRISTRLSADLASEHDAHLLDIEAAAPVLRSRAVDGINAQKPLQAVTSVFAGGRVEMIVEGYERHLS